MTEEQRDTLRLAIGYIGSSDRADRMEHVARLRVMLVPSAVAMDDRDAFEADYAKVWNAALKENGWNADHTADDVKELREGNTYGDGRDYLNARWEGWQARAASQQATATPEHSAIYISKRLTGSDKDASFVQAHINQAVSEAMELAATQPEQATQSEPFPYQKTFNAIAAATSVTGGHVAISVNAFRYAFGTVAQPEQVERALTEDRKQLMSFYAVDTPEKLVEAMERHIEKLQSKLPQARDTFPRTPREG